MTARTTGRVSGGPGRDVLWAFTGRVGGSSQGTYATLNLGDHVGDRPESVLANRAVMAAMVGLCEKDLVTMRQVHGTRVSLAAAPGIVADSDAIVTDRPDLGLVAMAADCVTLALIDAEAGVVAAVHSGWRGLAADVCGEAVSAFAGCGGRPGEALAILGPAICPTCYEVSPEVHAQVREAAHSGAVRSPGGFPAVDLHAGVVEQLRRRGVHNVRRDPGCTREDDGLFSYRRDGVTGRHGLIVRIVQREQSRDAVK